jgi:hypothetical protein
MTLDLSPQLRLAVLLGLLGILLLSGGVLVLPKLQEKSAPRAATAVRTSAPAPAPHVEPKPAPPLPKAPAAPRLPESPAAPAAVARALASGPVAVVALYAPGVGLDAQALAEARRGAAEAGAAFAAVSVADEPSARWVVATFDGTADPAVLVFRRGRLATTLAGYADAEIVAQAAAR